MIFVDRAGNGRPGVLQYENASNVVSFEFLQEKLFNGASTLMFNTTHRARGRVQDRSLNTKEWDSG